MFGADGMQMPGWRGSDGNAAYLDKTLRHQPIELGLDESVSGTAVWWLFVRAFLSAFVVQMLFIFIAVTTAISTAANDDEFSTGGSDDYSSAVGWAKTGGTVSTIVFWFVLLFMKRREPIGEWRVLLADSADRATSAYSQIAGTLRIRRIPVNTSYRRVSTGFGREDVSNRLVLSKGQYVAYVSVFGYGTSLYLGWMMWRTRLGMTLLVQFAVDTIGTLLRRTDVERRVLRTEQARAMREAVHAACREGLHSAIEGREVSTGYGFPDGLPPVEEERAPVAHSNGFGFPATPERTGPAPMPGPPPMAPNPASAPPGPPDHAGRYPPSWDPSPAPRYPAHPSYLPPAAPNPYSLSPPPPSVPPPPSFPPPPSAPPPSAPPAPHGAERPADRGQWFPPGEDGPPRR